MYDATESCHNPELVEEPVRLEPNITFTLEHVTELIVLGDKMSSAHNCRVVRKKLKID